MPFRFVHAADIHLDSPLRSLALRDAALAELIGNATRAAFVRVVEICLEEQVDALLLSGDLYDGEQTSMKTARFLAEQVRKLHQAGIRTFVIRGNHDALSKITRELSFPKTVTIFAGKAGAVDVKRQPGDLPITIHGISFSQPHAPESLLGKYRPPLEGVFNIGLMHTSLDGSHGHDPYAPCGLADLQASGFRYWALGHVHRRSAHHGASTVVMPGMPQGRDMGESGPKSVTLATVTDDGSIVIEERLTSVAQFERVAVDLAGVDDWKGVAVMIGQALARCRAGVASEHLVARLELVGATPIAWRLRRDLDMLRAEAEEQAAAIGRCWVDKIVMGCGMPSMSAEGHSAVGGGPIEELRRIIGEQVTSSVGFNGELARIGEDLRGALPVECRALMGGDEAAFAALIEGLVREGVEDVLARLAAPAAEPD